MQEARARDASGPDAGDGDTGDSGAGEGPAPDAGSDPESLLASSDAVQADVVFVTVLLNATEIRKNPAAADLGVLLNAIPQWSDFMRGTGGLVDPVRDADWILISGPSLRDTSADAITLHYNVADGVVDKAIQIVARNSVHGGPYEVGVPGVRAWLVSADNAPRVIVRPRSQLLVIVPPRSATGVARRLAHTKDKRKNIMPGVAAWVRVVDPHHALPSLVPEGVLEMRLKISPRDDGGADIAIEGDCKDEASAARAAPAVARTLRENNTFAISLGTHGLLNRPEVTSEGKMLLVRVIASREQVESTIAAAQFVLPPPAAPPPPPSASAASPRRK